MIAITSSPTAEDMLRDLHARYARVALRRTTEYGTVWMCRAVRWDHRPAVGFGTTAGEAIRNAWKRS